MERTKPPERTLGTPSLQQKDAMEHAYIPQQSAACDCFSQPAKCPSVCLASRHPPSFFIGVLLFCGFSCLSFSLSLNKRAVVVLFCFEHCGPFPTVDTLKLFTSAVLLAGQCSAVFSSQYPYF